MPETSPVNYINTSFEFKVLTPIAGRPTYHSLKTLHNQLKANARSVRSDLGGARHGHLGLVLSPAKYALLSNTPFVTPNHPGTLVIPANATQHMSRTLQDQCARTC